VYVLSTSVTITDKGEGAMTPPDFTPTVTLKDHFDDKIDAILMRLDRMDNKLDHLVETQSTLRVEHVKTGLIAGVMIGLAEIARHMGQK
jgi:hypothetical protein